MDSNKSSGIGFTGLLQVSLVVLKLCGVISWKWIWVLSPIWIATLLFVVFFVIVCIIMDD